MEENFVDTWGDQDLADPGLLPVGKRYIGEITAGKVETRNFSRPLKDGRLAVPMVTLSLKARKGVDGTELIGQNLQLNADVDFWIGKEDVIGRQSLARLQAAILGVTKQELFGQPVTESTNQCVGGKVTFEVTHREYIGQDGQPRKLQQPVKIKAATQEEMALLM